MEKQEPDVCIVVAMSRKNRAIGKEGRLLWHIPDDMKRFKELTVGHPVIMGRKTFDSIVSYLGGPLPGRTNIIVTRKDMCIEGCLVYHSFTKALEAAKEIDKEKVFIGGGSEIYKEALPHVDLLYLTLVDDEPEADSFFPDYGECKEVVEKEKREHSGLAFEWLTLRCLSE